MDPRSYLPPDNDPWYLRIVWFVLSLIAAAIIGVVFALPFAIYYNLTH